MVPLIARALTAGASAVAKRAAKKAPEKARKESDDITEATDKYDKYKVKNPNYSGDAPRRSPGYRDFETTSPRLSDEYKKGGKVAKYARGGGVESKGKTRGKFV